MCPVIVWSSLWLFFCVFEIKCGIITMNTTCDENVRDVSEFKINGTYLEEARKKEEEDLMSKILPMMVMPFMVQTTLLPVMLTSMKFMLAKSVILGKLAIFLGAVTLLRNYLKNKGGLYSHNVNIMHPPPHHQRNFDNQVYDFEKYFSSPVDTQTSRKRKRRRRTIRFFLN